jgi:hypothetical protein
MVVFVLSVSHPFCKVWGKQSKKSSDKVDSEIKRRYTLHQLLEIRSKQMPNWCNNTLSVTGDSDAIMKFLNGVSTVDTEGNPKYDILGGLYPIPQELKDTTSGFFTAEPNSNWKVMLDKGEMTQEWYDELVSKNAIGYAQNQSNLAKYGAKDWYDWCCSHWGTKWGDCNTELNGQSDTHLDFSFDSAWSPPIDGLAHISTMFPTLSFTITYEEGGMGYFGATKIENGETATSDGSHEDIEGYSEVDFGDEEQYLDFFDKITDAKDKCLCEVEAVPLSPLPHPDKLILAGFEAIRNGIQNTV